MNKMMTAKKNIFMCIILHVYGNNCLMRIDQ